MELQTSLQPSRLPSTVTRQHDMNQFLTAWNSPSDAHIPVMSSAAPSHLSVRDVAGDVADDNVKLDRADVYSTDPDQETDDDDEDRTAKQCVVGSEKVVQSLVAAAIYVVFTVNLNFIESMFCD